MNQSYDLTVYSNKKCMDRKNPPIRKIFLIKQMTKICRFQNVRTMRRGAVVVNGHFCIKKSLKGGIMVQTRNCIVFKDAGIVRGVWEPTSKYFCIFEFPWLDFPRLVRKPVNDSISAGRSLLREYHYFLLNIVILLIHTFDPLRGYAVTKGGAKNITPTVIQLKKPLVCWECSKNIDVWIVDRWFLRLRVFHQSIVLRLKLVSCISSCLKEIYLKNCRMREEENRKLRTKRIISNRISQADDSERPQFLLVA